MGRAPRRRLHRRRRRARCRRKTEFLAQRAAFLLQTGLCPAPRRILAISFKRDSAANLARRVADRLPEHAGRFVSLTFDAFTKGLVDRFRSALPQAWVLNGPYEIKFWTQRDQQKFVTGLALKASGKLQLDLYGLPGAKFLTDVVGEWALPPTYPARRARQPSSQPWPGGASTTCAPALSTSISSCSTAWPSCSHAPGLS